MDYQNRKQILADCITVALMVILGFILGIFGKGLIIKGCGIILMVIGIVKAIVTFLSLPKRGE